MVWKIIGMIAAVLTMFSFIPQIVKSVKTRSVKDVSLLTLWQLSAGVFLWIVYGVYRRDFIIITANLVTLTTLFTLLYLHFNYGKENR